MNDGSSASYSNITFSPARTRRATPIMNSFGGKGKGKVGGWGGEGGGGAEARALGSKVGKGSL